MKRNRMLRGHVNIITVFCLCMWMYTTDLCADPGLQAWGEEASQFLLPLTYANFDPVAYGRVYRENIQLDLFGKSHRLPLVFLKYNFVFLASGLTAGWDRVYGKDAGDRPLNYTIEQLPNKDPLYVSWIPLGEKKGIIGYLGSFYRTGPPGIDLMTWPAISSYGTILQFWYVDDGDETAATLFEKHFSDFYQPDFKPILDYNKRHFAESLVRLHPSLFE